MEVMNLAVRHQEELDRLRAETAVQKQNYERKIDEKESALRGKERELEGLQQNQGDVAGLRGDLQRAQSQLQQKDSEM